MALEKARRYRSIDGIALHIICSQFVFEKRLSWIHGFSPVPSRVLRGAVPTDGLGEMSKHGNTQAPHALGTALDMTNSVPTVHLVSTGIRVNASRPPRLYYNAS